MPSKKKKYNARFPPGRIKKIMQTDEEVGKVAQAVPIIISRTLELFVQQLLTKTMQITSAKQAKTLSPSHMKQCILSESRFDFLKDLVKGLPDVSGVGDDDTPPSTPSTAKQGEAENVSSSLQPVTRRHSTEHKLSKILPEVSNKTVQPDETVFTNNVPKFQISAPSSFNASQPNFYTEVSEKSSDNQASKNSLFNQPVANFSCTANIDEDYDT